MSVGIPDLGQLALVLEHRLVSAVSSGPMDKETSAEIADAVAGADSLDLASLLAWGRALHAAAAVCFARGDEDAHLLHDMAQRLIGMAFDRVALRITAVPDGAARH
jgi:hypothetical protein